ncbi:glycoside hydrolase family 13 protein [Nostocoides vanveenii]|uniref:Maltodextrin glucosidase n=1 Tax=Nostocoides vanveenii TaxID=330835 RepID=A0ABP4X2J6_9MICO
MTAPGHLLDTPHHDGSERYVSQAHPRLGDTVHLLVRVPHAADVSSIHLRSTPDAEPKFTPATLTRTTAADSWWSVPLVMHNPVMNYRFLLQGGPLGYQWLNGTGLHDRDIPDASDFRITTFEAAPAWSANAVVYQIFPDRFARSAQAGDRDIPDWAIPVPWDEPVAGRGPQTAKQLYGGDLDGIIDHLDHIVDLGADVVYLTPFFPGRSNHRYDASTFDEVDPVLGGDAALDRLADAVHERGLKVLGDFTTNHTGVGHDWFRAAQSEPDAPERAYYFFDGDTYASWLGVPSLPKLNYDSEELQEQIFEDPKGVVRHWISGPHALDGWRVDVANMTGRHRAQDHNADVARRMRAAMAETNPDALLVGEHCHDFSLDAMGDGWHGVMNYAGFTRPLWTWLRHPGHAPDFLGLPVIVPRLGGRAVMETIREFGSLVPWETLTHCFTLVGSHDTTRVRSLVGDHVEQVDVAAGMLLTMPGIPMITYGDEIGMLGDFGEDGRRPMPWTQPDLWDERLHGVYRELIALRHTSKALHAGGLRWVYAADDVLVYLREHPAQTALVTLARLAHEPIRLPRAAFDGIEKGSAAYGNGISLEGDAVVLTAPGPQVGVWTWQPVS